MGTRITGPSRGLSSGRPGPAGDHRTPSPLRGREPEWRRIAELFHRAGQGHRSVLLIGGPPGSGRTRMLAELVTAARRSRCIVFEQHGRVPPAAVRRLAQECERLATQLVAAPGSAAGPVLVIWDDPDWTGPFPALDTARTVPVLWALTRRTGAGQDAAAGILDAPGVTGVELRPLSTPAVGEVLADHLGAPPSTELIRLAAAAAGNPRALVDLVDGLRDEGLVEIGAGRARLTAVRLPERFAGRVRGQVARLSAPAARLVRVASAVGPSLRIPELAQLLGETTAGLLPTIEEALSSGLLVGADGRLTFSHGLVCETVAETLPSAVRGALRDDVDRMRATRPRPGDTARRPDAVRGRMTVLPTGTAVPAAVPATPGGRHPDGPADGWDALSEPERAIARLVSQAFTNRQIATRVRLSPHTVNYHLRQIYRKLDINSRVQLANLAQAHPAGPHTASSAS